MNVAQLKSTLQGMENILYVQVTINSPSTLHHELILSVKLAHQSQWVDSPHLIGHPAHQVPVCVVLVLKRFLYF